MATKTKTVNKVKQKTGSGKAVKGVQKQKRHEVVRAKILEIDDTLGQSYLNMSQLLSETYHKEYFELWGYEEGVQGFHDFCDAELDVGYRKSMYMIDIWDKVIEFKLDKKKVTALGWTKMKDIATVITAANANKWLDEAKAMTSREVTEACKISKRPDGSDGDVPSIVTMRFQMSESEASIVTDALAEAKKILDSQNDTNALEYVCQEWMGTAGVTPERASLADHIKGLETTFGVKLAVQEGKGKKGKSTEKTKTKVVEPETESVEGDEGDEGEGNELELQDLSKVELLSYMGEKELVITGAKKMSKKTLRKAIEAELEKLEVEPEVEPEAESEAESEVEPEVEPEESEEAGESIDDLLGL